MRPTTSTGRTGEEESKRSRAEPNNKHEAEKVKPLQAIKPAVLTPPDLLQLTSLCHSLVRHISHEHEQEQEHDNNYTVHATKATTTMSIVDEYQRTKASTFEATC